MQGITNETSEQTPVREWRADETVTAVLLVRALLHVILAHHGCLEYGSPVVPGTREATLVHAIDQLSGQLGAFARLAKHTPPDERWSRYDRALGTSAFLAGA
jgi:3'-5' exoribonuclease